MVRISIPTIKPRAPGPPSALTLLPTPQAAAHLGAFLTAGKGKILTITGAGVSVDSGIRAYRGDDGRYTNPNFSPIFYSELVDRTPRGDEFRKRYWGRSFLGYPPVRDAQPNPTHIYIALLQVLGLAPGLITQNVDNLHRKALGMVSAAFRDVPRRPILELHGTLAKVHCLEENHEATRDSWQEELAGLNPIWDAEAKWAEETGNLPRTNPDGDVELPGADYANFVVPSCGCGGLVKPNVIFFGETLPPKVKEESFRLVDDASGLLVLGSSLATYSAFRLIKAAKEQGKPILMLSLGPSRADGVVDKMEREAGPVLRAFLDTYLEHREGEDIDAARSVLDKGVTVALPAEDVVSRGAPAAPK